MTVTKPQYSDLNNNAFIRDMSAKLEKADIIEPEIYTKYDVKRGLRNANGTGVLVGLTRVSNVEGYMINEKNEKIAVPGKLYYRGYDVEDIIKGCNDEQRFGFEETT